MANNQKVFAKGIRTFKKNAKAPDFVLGTLVITVNELYDWIGSEGAQYLTIYNGQQQLKLQLTKKQDGGIMLAVDTFKPTQQAQPTQHYKPNNEPPFKVDDVNQNLPF